MNKSKEQLCASIIHYSKDESKITSPKARTKVTERITATRVLNMLSRRTGKAWKKNIPVRRNLIENLQLIYIHDLMQREYQKCTSIEIALQSTSVTSSWCWFLTTGRTDSARKKKTGKSYTACCFPLRLRVFSNPWLSIYKINQLLHFSLQHIVSYQAMKLFKLSNFFMLSTTIALDG